MIIPVRCFTCGNVLGSKYDKYNELKKEKEKKDKETNVVISDYNIEEIKKLDNNKEIFNKLMITRYCCKRHLISHIDLYFNI
tara:strand:- start:661 stop:906 length:246 start_codon:yes stop_codon:yes gene_type:complete